MQAPRHYLPGSSNGAWRSLRDVTGHGRRGQWVAHDGWLRVGFWRVYERESWRSFRCSVLLFVPFMGWSGVNMSTFYLALSWRPVYYDVSTLEAEDLDIYARGPLS